MPNSNHRQNPIIEQIADLKTTIPLAFKTVFSKPFYIAIAGAVFTVFWIVFNSFDQLLFFSPIITFYLTDDAIVGFILTNITSIKNSIFYTCGPPGMIKAMQKLLQEDLQIPKDRIKVEEFTGY
jgi:hypothetical protein